MEKMDNVAASHPDAAQGVQVYQLCFAQWKDGYYYPAVIMEFLQGHANVVFLDGITELVPKENIVELQEAFSAMEFQARWRGGFYYKGVLSSHEPLIMHYNDGDIEKICINQLRGKMPKTAYMNSARHN